MQNIDLFIEGSSSGDAQITHLAPRWELLRIKASL